MLGEVQNTLIDVFVENGDFSTRAISAINVAFKDIVSHPTLHNTFEHIGLREAGKDYWKIVVKAYEKDLKDFDVLKSLFQGSNQTHFNLLLEKPEEYPYRSSRNKVVTQEEPLPWDIEDLSLLFIEKAKQKSSLIAEVVDNPSQTSPQARLVTYHWLSREDAKSLLERYHKGSWTQSEQGLLFGVSYLSLKDWEPNSEKKDWYILATTPFSVVGAMSLVERPKEASLSLAYVSVAYGFRGEGVSKAMMNVMVEKLNQKNYWLKRTSPSEFVIENININQGFSRLLNEANVLYAPMHSELERELVEMENRFPGYDWKGSVLKRMDEIREKSQEHELKHVFAEIGDEIEKNLKQSPAMVRKNYPFKSG